MDIIGAASTCAIGGLALGYVCGALHRNAALGWALAKHERLERDRAVLIHMVGELECLVGQLHRENGELNDARARSNAALARENKRRADEKAERKAATYAALGPVANWPVREDVVAPVKAKRAGVKA